MDLRRPRALLQRLADAARPAGSECQEPAPAPEPTPAAESVPAPAPAPAPRVRGGAGMVDWWNARNAEVNGACQHPNPRTTQVGSIAVPYWCPDCQTELHLDIPNEPRTIKAERCDHPSPHAVRAQPTGELVAYWCQDCATQLPVPEEFDELEELADQWQKLGESDEVPETIRRRWDPRGSGKKAYARPAYGTRPAPRQSLVQWWMGIDGPSRWLLYNGTALAGGFAVHIPQFFTRETAYLVAHHPSWTDAHVCVWYGVAVLVLVIDRKTRAWVWPFALAGRVPLVSMVVGVLLYGNPV